MRTVHMAPDAVLVAAKVAVRENDSAEQITAGIDTAERRVRIAVPIATTIYLEPDIYRPTQADESDPAIRAVQRSHSPVPPATGVPMKPGNPENPAPADPAPASATAPAPTPGSGSGPAPTAGSGSAPAPSPGPGPASGPADPGSPPRPAAPRDPRR
jgi:hypothetical protein